MDTQHGKFSRTSRKPFSKLSLLRNRSGQGLVEFALAIPIFLLILLGVIESGRLLYIVSAVNAASREAARFGSTSDHFSSCDEIKGAATRIGSIAGISSSDVTVNYLETDDPCDEDHPTDFTCGCPAPDTIETGDRIRVVVSKTYNPMIPIPFIKDVPVNSESVRSIIHNLELSAESGEGPAETESPDDTSLKLNNFTIDMFDPDGKCNDWTATVTVSVVDENGQPLADDVEAIVTGVWVSLGGGSCDTTDGSCSITKAMKHAGTVSFAVNTISAEGYSPVAFHPAPEKSITCTKTK